MNDQYSAWTALLYVFNVIVGTGALTLPKAFSMAGWVFSTVLMILLSFISYVTVTFVVEAMSACNAISQWTKLEKMKRVSRYLREAINQNDQGSNEDLVTFSEEATSRTTLLPSESLDEFPSEPHKLFTLDRRIELGEMADVVFGRLGKAFFYICICCYLYGDLTIYSASIAKTLLDTTCTENTTISTERCWKSVDITQWGVYRLYLGLFLFVMGPFAFFNVQKTKYLQIATSLTRWLALTVMISLAIVRVSRGEGGPIVPPVAVPSALPALLGSSVYSFMCHHSLPSMLSPVKDKRRLTTLLALDYVIILVFYLTLSITAVFAFPHIEDLYTLNFEPRPGDPAFMEIVDYFLALFPVFTLTTTFPIIAVTLRNNIQALFSNVESQLFHRVFLPVVAVAPPVILASITQDIEALVGITGSFAGVSIQYLIPALLVVLCRTRIPEPISHLPNQYTSPFRSQAWPFVVIGWALLSIVLVTFNMINSRV